MPLHSNWCPSVLVYGAPKELSTDGCPPFTSSIFQEFLRMWYVKHRLSSVAYPQSNGRAELTVKTAKRIVNGNTGPPVFLGQWQCCSGHLAVWNTPIQSIALSPAQLLLHHWLCDSIPSWPILYKPHPEWVAMVWGNPPPPQCKNSRKV